MKNRIADIELKVGDVLKKCDNKHLDDFNVWQEPNFIAIVRIIPYEHFREHDFIIVVDCNKGNELCLQRAKIVYRYRHV